MTIIGIMQGRLVPPETNRIQSFPRARWKDEFENASLAGLNSIEWIFDEFGMGANPLETDDGVKTLLELSKKHKVQIRSICADYFMDKPFLRVSPEERKKSEDKLAWLIGQGKKMGINRLVLPFVDHAAINNEQELAVVIEVLKKALPLAEKTKLNCIWRPPLDRRSFLISWTFCLTPSSK